VGSRLGTTSQLRFQVKFITLSLDWYFANLYPLPLGPWVGFQFTLEHLIDAIGYTHTTGYTLLAVFGPESKYRVIKDVGEWLDGGNDDLNYSNMKWSDFRSHIKRELKEHEVAEAKAMKKARKKWRNDIMGKNKKGSDAEGSRKSSKKRQRTVEDDDDHRVAKRKSRVDSDHLQLFSKQYAFWSRRFFFGSASDSLYLLNSDRVVELWNE
jgi:hypothetical protein